MLVAPPLVVDIVFVAASDQPLLNSELIDATPPKDALRTCTHTHTHSLLELILFFSTDTLSWELGLRVTERCISVYYAICCNHMNIYLTMY